MDRLKQDVRFAVRRLLKNPLFTGIAIVSLAIGIGANTAVFTLINAAMIRELPLERPEELVEIYRSVAGFSHGTFSHPDYVELDRDSDDVFSEVAATRLAMAQTDVDGGIEVLLAEVVSGNYFTMQGVPAEIGRTLLPEDDVSPGGHPVAVLSHGFWRDRYGADPGVVGREIPLNGRPYTIVGVLPRSYTGNLRGVEPSLYAPTMMVNHLMASEADDDQLTDRGNQSTFLKGRLAPGVTLAQAQAAVDRLAAGFRSNYPDQWQGDNEIPLVPVSEVIMNPMIDRVVRPAAALLMGVVAMVLLIACANLASFLLAQAADRRKEIALRLALGARRGLLIRQLLTESVLLSLVGGAAGLLLSNVMLRSLVAADLPLPVPITLDLRPDGPVLAFSVAVTLAAALLFGLIPALQATNADVAPTLKDEGTGGGKPRRVTLRGSLVVAQVAISLVLLVGAGLFLRSLQARLAVDPGFGYEPTAILTIQTPPDNYTEEESRVFIRTYVEEVSRLPGVTAVGLTHDLHLNTLNNSNVGIYVDGVEPPPGQDYHLIDYARVDPGFFAAAGIPILAGRNFSEIDERDAPPVAIVSEAFARRFWPGEDPVGRVYRGREVEYTIVGVARDAKVRSLGEAPRPLIYRPYEQAFSSGITVIAQTRGDAERTAIDMLAVARRLEPELMVFEQKTMERHLGTMIIGHRLSAIVVSAFGLIALVLAVLGLYGVVGYAVSTRSREVGIRMSLGADPGSVVRLVMKGGLQLVAVGSAVGLILAFLLARLLSGLLFGVGTGDPLAFVLVPSLLLAVAVVAAWLPARRASAIDPVAALKAD